MEKIIEQIVKDTPNITTVKVKDIADNNDITLLDNPRYELAGGTKISTIINIDNTWVVFVANDRYVPECHQIKNMVNDTKLCYDSKKYVNAGSFTFRLGGTLFIFKNGQIHKLF